MQGKPAKQKGDQLWQKKIISQTSRRTSRQIIQEAIRQGNGFQQQDEE